MTNLTQEQYNNSHDMPKHLNPNEREYYLSCKVIIKDVSYTDEQSKGNSLNTEKMVFLIPEESDERTRFFMAWLPDDLDSHVEVGFEIGRPIFSVFRAAVSRRHEAAKIDMPLIFVMTKAVEELLINSGVTEVKIKSLAESNELSLDAQKDFELSNNKNR